MQGIPFIPGLVTECLVPIITVIDHNTIRILMSLTMDMDLIRLLLPMTRVRMYVEENLLHDNHDDSKHSNESICSKETWFSIVLFHHDS